MNQVCFTPLEETISFYTRNDFAILNNLMIGDAQAMWKYAELAYRDNQGILDEYESGFRTIRGDFDIKWINALRNRLIDRLDDETKKKIIEIAKSDIANILNAMNPAKEDMLLYRTAWIAKEYTDASAFPFSREYKALELRKQGIIEIKTFSSFSMTPYRENDEAGSDFYRYEIKIPKGTPVLELDQFECHNEDGEVVLPPMKCKIVGLRPAEVKQCRGVVDLEWVKPI